MDGRITACPLSYGKDNNMILFIIRVPTPLEEKKSSSFPVKFKIFGHISQPNIKHSWSAIVTKRLPNITECNQRQWTGWIYTELAVEAKF